MHIQYMSDLHLERVEYQHEVQPCPSILLAGDIGRYHDYDSYAAFLRQQCTKFDRVLLVAGNHEFYGSSRSGGLQAADDFATDPAMHPKLTIMDRTRVDSAEERLVVLGCTLYSHIAPYYTRLTNDFERIGDWTVKKHNADHQLDLEWLK